MNIILFDDKTIRQNLLPLTFTRPIGAIRVGILTIAEKWQLFSNQVVSFLTQDYLQKKFPAHYSTYNLYVSGTVCPTAELVQKLSDLKLGESYWQNDFLVAYHGDSIENAGPEVVEEFARRGNQIQLDLPLTVIKEVWEIFLQNGKEIKADFAKITEGRQSQPVNDEHTIVYGAENIFIEEGVKIRAAVLNAEDGPIYLGKNSQVQEGSLIKGPFALCEGSHVNMGGKMRGDNTVGPFSKVGGEVSNSVIFGYSNKGHDGFIGNTVIGEWCNIGADSNTSNLKNNYADVKLWHYGKNGFKNTGQQFCGLIMGDHSKCGINTMFNTGTVAGVSANIFGSGFPRNFIPSYSWGGAAGFETYQMRKVVEVAEKVMERRGKKLDQIEKDILNHVFEETRQYRVWDKV